MAARFLPSVLATLAAAGAALSLPAAALAEAGGGADWSQVQLFDGRLVFRGEGAITDQKDDRFRFWRPLQLGGKRWPRAGRMDCSVASRILPYSDAAFDLDRRYDAIRVRRIDNVYWDVAFRRENAPEMRRLDISGYRTEPHEHYVLTMIVMRDGERLYDVGMTCKFLHGRRAGTRDFAPFVRRHIEIVPVTELQPPAGKTPPHAQTH